MTGHDLEEYVSDCVVILGHRVEKRVSTEWIRPELAQFILDHARRVGRREGRNIDIPISH